MSRYNDLLTNVFFKNFKEGMKEVPWEREELVEVAQSLKMPLPKNLGDVIYSVRYRSSIPEDIRATAPEGKHWMIVGKGTSKYAFVLTSDINIVPRQDFKPIEVPDSTPDIIRMHALSDEQALLAVIRYNRLVDLFCQFNCYSLQNHLRTNLKDVGQIEIDELYVGIDKNGARYVVPVQAKGGSDKLGVPQVLQDYDYCKKDFPDMTVVPLSVQFLDTDHVAMLHLDCEGYEVRVVDEKHYKLVQSR